MRFRIFTEPQMGATYDQLLAVARRAEQLGFDAFFRSDHYLTMSGDGQPGPSDAWITLAALARDTATIRLGTLVTPITFRWPGPLAISVANVDAMSAGRVELGLGTGWFDTEHRAYGIPFPAMPERFEQLEEQLAIVHGLWSTPVGSTFSHAGRHYQLENSPALPKPVQQPHPPVIIGGIGARRTPRLAAQWADELNTSFGSVDNFAAMHAGADAACDKLGRDPQALRRTVALTVCCGEDDADVARRAARIGTPVDRLRSQLVGTPKEIVDRIGAYRAAGADGVYFQILDLDDLEHLDLIAAEVVSSF